MLCHGLTGSGDGFGGGFDVLASACRLIVPDLLGFGGSMDLDRSDFSLEAHLRALDEMLAALGLDDAPLTVVGHSMGAVLALHWASSRPTTRRVVSFCGPLYTSHEEAARHIRRMGLLERFYALETPLAERTCALMCEYRVLAQWVAVAVSPEWPVRLARQGVLHTWTSYLGGMNGVIQRAGWLQALEALEAAQVPVVLADGAHDAVPVTERNLRLAERFRCVEAIQHPEAGHDLPVAYPDWCIRIIDPAAATARSAASQSLGTNG